uniref:head-tail connector protein n=1 Tax=Brevundimonas sp. TaxID=1871086 RepID=UPI00289A315A
LTEDDEDTYVEGLIATAHAHIARVCGGEFDATSVEQQHAALLLVGHWFTNRVAVGANLNETPLGVDALLRPFMLAF